MPQIRYFYALALGQSFIFTSSTNRKPKQAGSQIREVDVREFSIRTLRNRIEIPHQREQHGEASEPGNELSSGAKGTVLAQITRQRDANQRIGHDEAIGRERTQPLEQMIALQGEAPYFVQNRCYARLGWDREIRQFCRTNKITYQGFSLLTANMEVLHHPLVAHVAKDANVTPAQIIFAFARSVGMLPLTGTSSPQHMQQDLASLSLDLPTQAIHVIEALDRIMLR